MTPMTEEAASEIGSELIVGEPVTMDVDVRAVIKVDLVSLPKQAAALVITDTASFLEAEILLKYTRGRRDLWKQHMAPHIEGAQEAKRVAEANRKRLVTEFDEMDSKLAAPEKLIADKIGVYSDEQEAAQKLVAEELQKKLAAESQDRILAEALALEEEALTAPTREEGEAIAAEVDALLDAPIPETSVSLGPAVPKVGGFSRPEQWSAAVINIKDLLKALIEGKLDKPLTEDLTKRITDAVGPALNLRARALKSALKIPGVSAVKDRGYRLR